MGPSAAIPLPARVLISYAPADEAHATELEKHLSALKCDGLIETYSKRKLLPGQHIDEAFKKALNEASLVLVLVSADYVAAEASWEGELRTTLLAKLVGLPAGEHAVTQWEDKDSAWTDVATGLRAMLDPRTTRTHKAGGETQSAGDEPQAKVQEQKCSAARDEGTKPKAVAKPDRGEEREPPPPESRTSSPRWLLPVGLALGVIGLIAVVIISLSIPPNPGPMLHIALSKCERTITPASTKPAPSVTPPVSGSANGSCKPGTVKMEFHPGREGACGAPPAGTRPGPDGVIWWKAGEDLDVPLNCSCKASQ